MWKQSLFLSASLLIASQGFSAEGPSEKPQRTSSIPSVDERTTGMRKIDGYFPIYWDERTGSMFLEIPRLDVEFLLTAGLSAGLGSNDIGLDRGQGGPTYIVLFQRAGPRVMLVQNNQLFRSSSKNTLERKSVEDSFAKSILWGFAIVAESPGRILVDATDFLLRDVVNATGRLRPGNYRLDRSRSAFFLPNTRNFPKNTEVDMTLTFVNEATGGGGGTAGPAQGPAPIGTSVEAAGGGRSGLFSGSVGSVSPSSEAVTLREHLSFVELPDGNFQPRADDPRAGYNGITYLDYSLPVGEPMQVRYLRRHRLQKKDPSAAMSESVKPIQYWVDPGAPEDIKKALIEGANWWNQAFETAGFLNAFEVNVLPEGADPMDIRYNMINWVHRSTRGWSVGNTVTDPRTGEIIKAIVTLGSLRDRQDYMIFEGLLSPYVNGNERPGVLYEATMARIRQLAAHEIGHTLGLSHNYYSSAKGWISVMDYPHPLATLKTDGTIDLSKAYAARIGDWDKVAINFGYREFAKGAEQKTALTKIINDAWTQDLRFYTNQDTDIHPRVDQWSNGDNQADELMRLIKVRRSALKRIGENTIRPGTPMVMVEEALVPIYMYHRYAVESAASMIGGQDFTYAMRGDGRTPMKWVDGNSQRKAINALTTTLKASELAIPKRVLDLLAPRPPGYGMHRELFPRTTGEGFDPINPAVIAADVTIGFVLQPDRAARMVAQNAMNGSLPGLGEVIDRLVKATFHQVTSGTYQAEIRRATQRVLVDRIIWLASVAPNAQVRAISSFKLRKLHVRLRAGADMGELDKASNMQLSDDIRRFLERPVADQQRVFPAPPAPPGAPIGDGKQDWLARPFR